MVTTIAPKHCSAHQRIDLITAAPVHGFGMTTIYQEMFCAANKKPAEAGFLCGQNLCCNSPACFTFFGCHPVMFLTVGVVDALNGLPNWNVSTNVLKID